MGLERYLRQFPLLGKIENRSWLEAACRIWDGFEQSCSWEDTEQAMLNINPVKGTLADYIRAIMSISYESAKILSSVYSLDIDFDILLLSAFLHDTSKLVEYEKTADGYRKSYIGEIYQHGFLSAHSALNENLPEEVVSNIICHTPQSNHKICTIEGMIIAFADKMITSSKEIAGLSI